jgi:hypothetical protein
MVFNATFNNISVLSWSSVLSGGNQLTFLKVYMRDRVGRMIVGFKTIYAISAYHTTVGSSNPAHGKLYSIQHYMVKYVSDLW